MLPTVTELAALRAACESWVGTPFCPNSAVKGAGVCCHKFVGSAYMEAGWLPSFPMPNGNPYGSEIAAASPFEPWLDASPMFERHTFEEMQAGDLVLSKPSRLPWHVSIFLGDDWFAHVDMKQGAVVTNTFPAAWIKRVVCVYRPVST